MPHEETKDGVNALSRLTSTPRTARANTRQPGPAILSASTIFDHFTTNRTIGENKGVQVAIKGRYFIKGISKQTHRSDKSAPRCNQLGIYATPAHSK